MDMDIIADIVTSIRNALMGTKGMVRIASINIMKNIAKILLREGFIENVRKHWESNKYFLLSTLRHRRNRKGTYRNILKRISRPGLRIYSKVNVELHDRDSSKVCRLRIAELQCWEEDQGY